MSYTPEDQKTEGSIVLLREAIQGLSPILLRIARDNNQNWNRGFKDKCLEMNTRLLRLELDLSEIET